MNPASGSKFDPEFYSRYRPLYPPELFEPLGGLEAAVIADVACGTGHSTLSLLRALGRPVRLIGVEPDPGMLAKARETKGLEEVEFVAGSGENTTLPTASLDAATIGSAFHWMDGPSAAAELARILKPGSLALMYEYQFPKSAASPELNEWIRRQFNLRWKAPAQKPRGDFEQVTRPVREHPAFEALGYRKVPMVLNLDSGQLSGLIFSQSRVLHFEAGMSAEERARFHAEVLAQVRGFLGEASTPFDFALQAGTFRRRA